MLIPPAPSRFSAARPVRASSLAGDSRTGIGSLDAAFTTEDRRQYMDNGTRSELLSRLAEAVGSVANAAHPTRAAVDGPPAAGKTTLADDLAVVLLDPLGPGGDRRFR
ncbi:hypothetical protein [Kribbella sp. NPDC049227]|uniref:hypothetical protein n=1 Tax=Kribbella sp. NPDC049227 TaxID=3364113 RepID=UPI0037140BA1